MSESEGFRVAVVTGAARGIGMAISERLASEGFALALLDKDPDALGDAASRIASLCPAVLDLECDVTSKESVSSAASRILEAFRRVDVLVNNAGWDRLEEFLETDEELWQRIVDVNYMGTLRMCKALVPTMVEAGYGRVVNISSDAARVGSTGEAVYAGAKAALIAFSKSLAREVAQYGVTVNVVCPGPTKTPLLEELRTGSERGERVIRAMTKAIPMKRPAEPSEVAHAVAFFASEEAGYITGQVLSVSGGLTMVG